MDANFLADGTEYEREGFDWTDSWIHEPQLEWLASDLKAAAGRPVIVLTHQTLEDETTPHGVKNARVIRSMLEAAGNVVCVIEGHNHAGVCVDVNGILYFAPKAMRDCVGAQDNAYAVVSLGPGRGLTIEGFGSQEGLRRS